MTYLESLERIFLASIILTFIKFPFISLMRKFNKHSSKDKVRLFFCSSMLQGCTFTGKPVNFYRHIMLLTKFKIDCWKINLQYLYFLIICVLFSEPLIKVRAPHKHLLAPILICPWNCFLFESFYVSLKFFIFSTLNFINDTV